MSPAVMSAEETVQSFVVAKNIQAGTVQKKATGLLKVTFPQAFTGTPVVVLTPYWALQKTGAGYAETVVAVTAEDFTLSSNNWSQEGNYFVNWVAYGKTS